MPAGVVAADIGRLDAAQALAQENGVADRIEFRQCDLADLPAATGRFDVILGMIYHNEPRRDLAQQQLMAGLATRFAHPGTAFIPGTVRYTVAGYDSSMPRPGRAHLARPLGQRRRPGRGPHRHHHGSHPTVPQH